MLVHHTVNMAHDYVSNALYCSVLFTCVLCFIFAQRLTNNAKKIQHMYCELGSRLVYAVLSYFSMLRRRSNIYDE